MENEFQLPPAAPNTEIKVSLPEGERLYFKSVLKPFPNYPNISVWVWEKQNA